MLAGLEAAGEVAEGSGVAVAVVAAAVVVGAGGEGSEGPGVAPSFRAPHLPVLRPCYFSISSACSARVRR
jgi:hypothetical protein